MQGGIYEIGALRALNDILLDRTVNDFDVYVGTSAGSLISACLANGIGARRLMRAVTGDAPAGQRLEREHLFRPDTAEIMRRLRGLPADILWAVVHYLRHRSDMDLLDFALLFTEALPAGMLTMESLEGWLRALFAEEDRTDDFRKLRRELAVVTTELDSGERAVFSSSRRSSASISRVVAASCSIPVVYSPVRIEGRDHIDGGVRGNASLDLALEAGAKLVICINPLVPYRPGARRIPFLGPDHRGSLRGKGAPHIAGQVFRTWVGGALEYQLKNLRRRHPDVDFILIEPRRDDPRMFFYNVMRYSSRLLMARHGYESVSVMLEENYPRYREIFARHGISITRNLVGEQLKRIRRSAYDPDVIREVLQSRRRRHVEVRGDGSGAQLAQALEQLDRRLEYLLKAG